MNAYRPGVADPGRILGEAYASSPRGEKVTALHLFGIIHAERISGMSNLEPEQIAAAAGLMPSFATELRRVVKLLRHVVPAGADRRASPASVFAQLARPLPSDYRFDRDEANAR